MEGYKDILLSQPPAMYQRVPQMSNVTLENYKGILLCACPTNVPPGRSTELRGGDGAVTNGTVFVPAGGCKEPLGLGPSTEHRALMERNHRQRIQNTRNQRAHLSAVVQQHRRWLRSFAEQIRNMKKEEVEREVERARRVRSTRRKWTQRVAESNDKTPQETREPADVVRGEPEEQRRGNADNCRGSSPSAKEAKDKPKVGKKKKPKWALTEDEALEDEIAEADDLLEFAKNLDYDKFISDYEVAGALAVMRDRVQELTRENNWSKESVERAAKEYADDDVEDEYDGENEVEEERLCEDAEEKRRRKERRQQMLNALVSRKAAPAQAAEHDKEWSNSTAIAGVLRQSIMRDALLLAERILASSESMQKIHTKFSLARVLQRCAVCGDDPREAMQKPSIGGLGGPKQAPRIVKLHADATGLESGTSGAQAGEQRVLLEMQRSKDRTQGLPYLYRCPAI
uniref:Uncharacterized protein n=1 Tax=Trypanosoma congolense (strain IL3000) TaxID=1068625 RepID=G0UMQ1_TRYCI|nr:conserved hypothetical protein [Trypanosoma congolense IL3000]